MGEQTLSNLYFWCCPYPYAASCVYKTVCLYDFLFFTVLLINAITWGAKAGWVVILVLLLLVALFVFLAVKSIILFFTYNDSLADGSLHTKTQTYLGFRRCAVILLFIEAFLFPVLFILIGTVFAGAVGSQDHKDAGAAAGAAFGFFLFFAIIILLILLPWALTTWGFQKSLEEANNTISGVAPQGGLPQGGLPQQQVYH